MCARRQRAHDVVERAVRRFDRAPQLADLELVLDQPHLGQKRRERGVALGLLPAAPRRAPDRRRAAARYGVRVSAASEIVVQRAQRFGRDAVALRRLREAEPRPDPQLAL